MSEEIIPQIERDYHKARVHALQVLRVLGVRTSPELYNDLLKVIKFNMTPIEYREEVIKYLIDAGEIFPVRYKTPFGIEDVIFFKKGTLLTINDAFNY